MQYLIEVDYDSFEGLIRQQLQANIDNIIYFKEDPEGKKLAKAHLRVLKYMSVPSDYEEIEKHYKPLIKELP